MPSATLLYSFPAPLGRRGTTAVAVVALHVVLALGVIASMTLAPPKQDPTRWVPPPIVRPPEPPQPARHVEPGGMPWVMPATPFVPPDLPDHVTVQPAVVPDAPPIQRLQPEEGTVSEVRVLRGPSPLYPASERRLEHEGVVTVHVRVDASGRAQAVEIATSSGHPRLDEAAVVAVRQWIFAPAQNAAGPIVSWVTLSVRFRLTG